MKFKVGDEVKSVRYGVGTVTNVNSPNWNGEYPIEVKFNSRLTTVNFTPDGYRIISTRVEDERIRKLTKLDKALK